MFINWIFIPWLSYVIYKYFYQFTYHKSPIRFDKREGFPCLGYVGWANFFDFDVHSLIGVLSWSFSNSFPYTVVTPNMFNQEPYQNFTTKPP